MDPSLANVWFNLANAHLKLGEEEEAARWRVFLFSFESFRSTYGYYHRLAVQPSAVQVFVEATYG